MLTLLTELRTTHNADGPGLRTLWHDRMEKDYEGVRHDFFLSVIEEAEEASCDMLRTFPRTNAR